MTESKCKPGNYGPCRTCDRTVTLVLFLEGKRQPQARVDTYMATNRQSIINNPDDRWKCEHCMERQFGTRADWEIDDVTKSVLSGKQVHTVDPPRILADPHDAEKIRGVTSRRDAIFASMV